MIPISDDEKKFTKINTAFIGGAVGIVVIGLGVVLGFTLKDPITIPIYIYKSPWKLFGSSVTHPLLYIKAELVGYIFTPLRSFGANISLSNCGDCLDVSTMLGERVSVFEFNHVNVNWTQMGEDFESKYDKLRFEDFDEFYEAIGSAILSGDGTRVVTGCLLYSNGVYARRVAIRISGYGDISKWKQIGD